VIFGHSSYYKNDNGRYKTHFQKIIELEEGEEVWVYKKSENGEYIKYRYKTTKSYEVKANDVSVLDPGIGKNLTLFTCTPIG
jgi:LPXTG-site transpeptidase (sortase) family protein